MILKKIVADDGSVSYTESGDNNLVTNLIDGVKAPLLKDDEFLSSGAAFWGSIAYATAGVVGGSMYARKRQAAGQPPFLKVFF
jgi:hypothetical protein